MVNRTTGTASLRWLHVGAHVIDTRSERVGVVMSIGLRMGGRQFGTADRVWLRPPGGGVEWEAKARHLAPGRHLAPAASDAAGGT